MLDKNKKNAREATLAFRRQPLVVGTFCIPLRCLSCRRSTGDAWCDRGALTFPGISSGRLFDSGTLSRETRLYVPCEGVTY